MQAVKRRNLNQNMSTNKLVWATHLKAIGLQGMGGEEGILSMALNTHVFKQGPKWLACVCQQQQHTSLWRERSHIARGAFVEAAKLDRDSTFFELLRSGQVTLIKICAGQRKELCH